MGPLIRASPSSRRGATDARTARARADTCCAGRLDKLSVGSAPDNLMHLMHQHLMPQRPMLTLAICSIDRTCTAGSPCTAATPGYNCAEEICGSDSPECVACGEALMKSNLKLVHVLQDSSAFKLFMFGQTPEVILQTAQAAINFYSLQQQAKRKVQEVSQQRYEVEQENRELHEKYQQKSNSPLSLLGNGNLIQQNKRASVSPRSGMFMNMGQQQPQHRTQQTLPKLLPGGGISRGTGQQLHMPSSHFPTGSGGSGMIGTI
eukprot:gene25996-11684_t